MKNTLWISIGLLLVSTFSNAQNRIEKKDWSAENNPIIQQLKDNPDIVWLGETMVDYIPSYTKTMPSAQLKKYLSPLGIAGTSSSILFKTIKLQSQNLDQLRYSEHQLAYKLLENCKKIGVYEDANLTKKITDPKANISPRNILSFRVKQLIYYNQKEMLFRSLPLAIAPLVVKRGSDGAVTSVSPLFWLKANAINQVPNWTSSSISWAKRSYRDVLLSNVHLIKKDISTTELIQKMMKDLKTNAKKVYLGETFSADGSTPIAAEDILKLGTSIDTIFTFDPVTFEEKRTIGLQELDGKHVQKIRFIQDWFWEADKQQLSFYYQGFTPIMFRYDNAGKFLNAGPIFVRRVGKDK